MAPEPFTGSPSSSRAATGGFTPTSHRAAAAHGTPLPDLLEDPTDDQPPPPPSPQAPRPDPINLADDQDDDMDIEPPEPPYAPPVSPGPAPSAPPPPALPQFSHNFEAGPASPSPEPQQAPSSPEAVQEARMRLRTTTPTPMFAPRGSLQHRIAMRLTATPTHPSLDQDPDPGEPGPQPGRGHAFSGQEQWQVGSAGAMHAQGPPPLQPWQQQQSQQQPPGLYTQTSQQPQPFQLMQQQQQWQQPAGGRSGCSLWCEPKPASASAAAHALHAAATDPSSRVLAAAYAAAAAAQLLPDWLACSTTRVSAGTPIDSDCSLTAFQVRVCLCKLHKRHLQYFWTFLTGKGSDRWSVLGCLSVE